MRDIRGSGKRAKSAESGCQSEGYERTWTGASGPGPGTGSVAGGGVGLMGNFGEYYGSYGSVLSAYCGSRRAGAVTLESLSEAHSQSTCGSRSNRSL